MTNVPEKIREAWADVYRLFDVSYNMDGSAEAWKQYWNKANELIQKYGDEIPVLELLESVANMIAKFVDDRNKNESLLWNANEDYPFPKEIK